MKRIKDVIIFLIIYVYIYNPVFVVIGFGSIKFLLIISTIFILSRKKILRKYLILHKSIIKLLLFLIIYTALVVSLCNGNATKTSYSLFIYLIETTILPIFLIEWVCDDNKIKIIPLLLDVGFAASLISIFLLFTPNINDYVLGSVITLPIEDNNEWTRCFGLAEGLTSSYGVIQGILASLALLLLEKNSIKYLVYFITLSISAMINARTGLVPIIFTIGYKFIYCIVHRKFTFPLYVGIIWTIGIIIASYLSTKFEETYKYITLFFTATFDYLIKGEANDYYASIDRFLQMPNSLFVTIFGEGKTLFGADVNSSDIAYVNQIFTGGLVYLVGLLIIQYKIFKVLYQNITSKYISILLLLTALIINFKGIDFCMSESFSRFVMLCVFMVYHNLFSKNKLYLLNY